MRLSTVKEFFSGQITAEQLCAAIELEVRDYARAASTRGKSMPINLHIDIPIVVAVGRIELDRLFKAFLAGATSIWALRYVCEAILLSDAIVIETKQLRELVEFISDELLPEEQVKRKVVHALTL